MSLLPTTPGHSFVTIWNSLATFLAFVPRWLLQCKITKGVHLFDISLYSSQDILKLSLVSNIRGPELQEAVWQQFDDMFRTLRSQMPTAPIHTIFGFWDRESMLEFAETLPSRMPAVAGETTLHYAMKRYNDPRGEGWYQASLDSEELRGAFCILLPCPTSTDETIGEPKRELWDIYPIELLGSS